MMLEVLAVIAVIAVVILFAYLVGLRDGVESKAAEAHLVRAQAASAERQLHELTRQAFIAMAEEADRRGKSDSA